jgi:hypothetical protein
LDAADLDNDGNVTMIEARVFNVGKGDPTSPESLATIVEYCDQDNSTGVNETELATCVERGIRFENATTTEVIQGNFTAVDVYENGELTSKEIHDFITGRWSEAEAA